MASINQEINNLLNQYLSIQKCLKRSIVNTRALAKFLVNEHDLKYPLDAVISAIRRYDLEKVSLLGFIEINKLFSTMVVTTKDNVAMIVLRDKVFKDVCDDFLNRKTLKENLRIVKSKEVLSLVVKQKDLDAKLALFKPNEILNVHKNLSEIRIEFAKDITQVKGIVARISAELAMRNVNIEGVIYGVKDLLLYVKEGNLISSLQALRGVRVN